MAGLVNFKHSCIMCKTLEVFWHVTLIKKTTTTVQNRNVDRLCSRYLQSAAVSKWVWDERELIWGGEKGETDV